jgi:hypothetical protein
MCAQIPREPRPGEPLLGAWGAEIVRYLRAITPRSSPTIAISTLSNGTTFRGDRKRGATTSDRLPFEVYDASTLTEAKVGVFFGDVHSITPTMGGIALDTVPPPTMAVITGEIYLRVDLDGDGQVISASIGNAADLPANTETEGYRRLGTVTVTDVAVTAIAQAVTHSLEHQKCGTTVHNFWGV